jgi:hypothetical protein
MLRTMLVGCFCFALAASDVIAQVPVPRTPASGEFSIRCIERASGRGVARVRRRRSPRHAALGV